jgi:hypothetical protein
MQTQNNCSPSRNIGAVQLAHVRFEDEEEDDSLTSSNSHSEIEDVSSTTEQHAVSLKKSSTPDLPQVHHHQPLDYQVCNFCALFKSNNLDYGVKRQKRPRRGGGEKEQ